MIKSFIYKNFPKYGIWYRNLTSYGYEPEMKLIPMLLNKGEVSIDIGAHLGNWTYLLSKSCESVISFEPNIFLSSLLSDCEIKNCKVHNVALSNIIGYTDLILPVVNEIVRFGNASINNIDDFKYDSLVNVAVKLLTLDHYNYKNVGLIKIDVESAELNVIEGAIKTIEDNKPNLIIEINFNSINNLTSIFNILKKLKYNCYVYYNNKLLPNNNLDVISKNGNYIFSTTVISS